MKYYTRARIYKASNVSFDPNNLQAYSYSWWRFVEKYKGKVIFNDHFYSPSTSKHQSKVRSLMHSLGIRIDLTLSVPLGLQNAYAFKQASNCYLDDIKSLQAAIAKPRSHKAKNAERELKIKELTKLAAICDRLAKKRGEYV